MTINLRSVVCRRDPSRSEEVIARVTLDIAQDAHRGGEAGCGVVRVCLLDDRGRPAYGASELPIEGARADSDVRLGSIAEGTYTAYVLTTGPELRVESPGVRVVVT